MQLPRNGIVCILSVAQDGLASKRWYSREEGGSNLLVTKHFHVFVKMDKVFPRSATTEGVLTKVWDPGCQCPLFGLSVTVLAHWPACGAAGGPRIDVSSGAALRSIDFGSVDPGPLWQFGPLTSFLQRAR